MHRWKDAPPSRAYLAAPHRHLFGVRVELSVDGLDREVEFHDLKDAVISELPDNRVVITDDTNPWLGFSCEHHARRIAGLLSSKYPKRLIRVTVDEDGECGASVEIEGGEA
jgi:hypothetical protein